MTAASNDAAPGGNQGHDVEPNTTSGHVSALFPGISLDAGTLDELDSLDAQLDAVAGLFEALTEMSSRELQVCRDTFGHAPEFWSLFFDAVRARGVW